MVGRPGTPQSILILKCLACFVSVHDWCSLESPLLVLIWMEAGPGLQLHVLGAEHTVDVHVFPQLSLCCCIPFLHYLKCSIEECPKEQNPESFGTELFLKSPLGILLCVCYKI